MQNAPDLDAAQAAVDTLDRHLQSLPRDQRLTRTVSVIHVLLTRSVEEEEFQGCIALGLLESVRISIAHSLTAELDPL